MANRAKTTFFFPGIGGNAIFHAPLIAKIRTRSNVVEMNYDFAATLADLEHVYADVTAREVAAYLEANPSQAYIVACSYGVIQALRVLALLPETRFTILFVSPALPHPRCGPLVLPLLGISARMVAAVAPSVLFWWSERTIGRAGLEAQRRVAYRDGRMHARRRLRHRFEDLATVVAQRDQVLLQALAGRTTTIVGGKNDPLWRWSMPGFRTAGFSQPSLRLMTVAGDHALNLVGSTELSAGIDRFYDA